MPGAVLVNPKLVAFSLRSLSLALLCLATVCSDVRIANAQLANGSIVASEFFEEILLIDPITGSATDVLNSNPFTSPFGQLIEVLDPDSVILSSFRELHHYDVASRSTMLLGELSFVPSEITRTGTGDLIAVGTGGVVHVDVSTAEETLIYDATFFSARDAVVDDRGLIYITEFFDALGVVDPVAQTFTRIGDFPASKFLHIDLGPDGYLYLSTVFGGEFYRVHPQTGNAKLLATVSTASIEDIQVTDSGEILFAGLLNSIEGIHAIDPLTGNAETLLNGENLNGGFFSLLDFDVYNMQLRSSIPIPEPSSLALLLVSATISLTRMRGTQGQSAS